MGIRSTEPGARSHGSREYKRAYLTAVEAAREIGVHRNTLSAAMRRGDVSFVDVAGRQRITALETARLAARRRHEREGLTVGEVARILRVTSATITDGIKRGEIPGAKRLFGAGYFVHPDELRQWSERNADRNAAGNPLPGPASLPSGNPSPGGSADDSPYVR